MRNDEPSAFDKPREPRILILTLAGGLSDQELIARVKDLAQREREATVVLIAHLAVLDERRLYLEEGCSSLFTYCTEVLHLSAHAAYGRIQAARAARSYPIILDLLCHGSVNLTTVGLLAPELTAENHRELLDAARHKSKRQVEELVAGLRPRPSIPTSIRRLVRPRHASASISAPDEAGSSRSPADVSGSAPRLNFAPAPGPAPAPRATITPLAAERYRVQFTATAETYRKLRLAQDLMRHQIPDGDVGEILDRALTALVRDLAKEKFAATDRPRGRQGRVSPGTTPGSRHIPAAVRRAVWIRDGGRCAYVAHNGRRCAERAFLEFHHVVPHSTGGEATADNIQLRCRAHNNHEAALYFGLRAAPAVTEPPAVNDPGVQASHRTGAPAAAT